MNVKIQDVLKFFGSDVMTLYSNVEQVSPTALERVSAIFTYQLEHTMNDKHSNYYNVRCEDVRPRISSLTSTNISYSRWLKFPFTISLPFTIITVTKFQSSKITSISTIK